MIFLLGSCSMRMLLLFMGRSQAAGCLAPN